jgi:broad specificity phosphatase PhoE
MGKTTIHCVRHAQGFHNLNTANHAIRDPDLTPLGQEQCAILSREFPYHDQVTHLVASPLRRTLYTCLLSFPEEVRSGLKVIALPELQETSDLPCDTGSDPSKLEQEFGPKGEVNLDLVHEGWNKKHGKWSPAASAIEVRAREARLWLRQLADEAGNGDKDIVVVTHGGYLHYFTEDWTGYEKFLGTGWSNTEYRSYEFWDPSSKDPGASLVETKESRLRRNEKPLSEAEQRNLRDSAMKEWMKSGFQGEIEESAKL